LPNDHHWDAELGFEVDTKQSKFLAQERSYTLKVGPQGSKWRFRLENTRRKNAIDNYASREYLRDETMPTYKHSLALSYANVQETVYNKAEVELALPTGADSSSFFKVDGFHV
jgi:hypothetical protein